MILIAKSLGYISKVSIFVCKLIIMLMNFLELVKARYSAWSVYAWLPRQLISNRGGLK